MSFKKIITLGTILLLLVAIPLTVKISQEQQRTRSQASANSVNIAFNPDTATKAVGEEFSVLVTANVEPAISVSAADIRITFPKDVVELVRFDKSNTLELVFINTPASDANGSGTFRYASGAGTNTSITPGPLILGTLIFKAKTTGSADVTVSASEITAVGQSTALTNATHSRGSFTFQQAATPTTPLVPPTEVPTNTPIPTPIPTTPPNAPTNTPTPTAIPTPTPTLVSTPTPDPTSAQLVINNITLEGITSGRSPSTLQKNITVDVLDSNNNAVGSPRVGILTHRDGTTTAFLNIGSLTPGAYIFKIKIDKYLRKQFPGFVQVTNPTQQITLPQVTLTAGDINNDNQLDISDYNAMLSCFLDKANSSTCANRQNADLNEDGPIDEFDHNIFIRGLKSRSGD